ncbi:prolyl-tRNA synthetase associated domain-containing protein [Rufibacter tibetensis]|uniref:Prolyl-tRNA synthetase n=1 Tax=Rufibacter tibetensis TaxID=512763 RepID=A0A0P0CZL3_9BACT|nr:YbaK/EbsC family protein [Rufibacter tibetensis]ALJ00204.1 prolyl-tRNA synthetase [Rufibacter tibetensis]
MFYTSEIKETAPLQFKTPLQEKVYTSLHKLDIPFQRVDTDDAISMEDCIEINRKLNMKMVKTLFLCNRQQSVFYLFVTTGDKPFSSKAFSNALGAARLSFAPEALLNSMLGTSIGAATVYSVLLDRENKVQVVFDEEVASEEWYGCSDGTTTGYMKVKTTHIIHDFLEYASHKPTVIQV